MRNKSLKASGEERKGDKVSEGIFDIGSEADNDEILDDDYALIEHQIQKQRAALEKQRKQKDRLTGEDFVRTATSNIIDQQGKLNSIQPSNMPSESSSSI